METRDEQMWQLAKQRVKFKQHVLTYFLVNVFLWIIWFLSDYKNNFSILPWPAWCSIGWGFALFMKYIRLYHISTNDAVQKEYDKLKNKQP